MSARESGEQRPEAASGAPAVRRAKRADAAAIGRLLDAFNREYDWPTPGPDALAARIGELLAGPDFAVLLAGEPPAGLGVLRFRPSIWSTARECYLAELYVAPDRRGEGLGRALMAATLELARAEGAETIDLGTSEDDVAARGLYERFGFTNREHGPDGPLMFVYEREL